MGVMCPKITIESLPQDNFLPYRRRYWDCFQKLSLPLYWKCPAQRAVPRKEEIDALILPQCRASCIVFVDGYYDRTLSNTSALPLSCAILPMNEAAKSYGSVLQDRQIEELQEEREALAALNGALQGEGLFFFIPSDITIPGPVQVLSILGSNGLMAPRIELFLGKRSSLEIVQTFYGQGTAIDVIDISLDSSAHLQIVDTFDGAMDAKIDRYLRASIKKDAQIDSFSGSMGAAMLHRSHSAILCEEGASAIFNGLDRLHKTREAHTRLNIMHRAPRSFSRQHFKKILEDQSRSSCQGNVRIERDAQKSDASQHFSHLILSDAAIAKAQPDLEIFADDVKVSHGATFSQPGAEALFYLQSRGLSLMDAKQLWMQGFCRELIEGIGIPFMREEFLRKGLR
jgi:Fe-S cluster assembly protein SufD